MSVVSFIQQYVWLLPIVVAITNRFKAKWPKVDPFFVALPVGVAVAEIATYFPVLPLFAKVLVGGLALAMTGSGTYDLFKLFGTLTVKEE